MIEISKKRKKRILIVEDDGDLCLALRKVLRKEGYEVEAVFDGEKVYEMVKNNPPDLVSLDVMMGEKDGYKVCEELKSDPKTVCPCAPLIKGNGVKSNISGIKTTP